MKTREIIFQLIVAVAVVTVLAMPATGDMQKDLKAGKEKALTQLLIKNVNIFNGTSGKLIAGKDVLI